MLFRHFSLLPQSSLSPSSQRCSATSKSPAPTPSTSSSLIVLPNSGADTDDTAATAARFSRLLSRSYRAGNHRESFYLLDYMVSAFSFRPRPSLCTKLIRAFAADGDARRAARVLSLLEQSPSGADTRAYNAFVSCIAGDASPEELRRVLARMRQSGCPPDTVTYHIIVVALCRRGEFAAALSAAVDGLSDDRIVPSAGTYAVLIRSAIAAGGGTIDGAMRVVDVVPPDDRAMITVVRALCRDGEVDAARQFLDGLRSRGCWRYSDEESSAAARNILLRSMLSHRRWDDALKLAMEMLSSGDGAGAACSAVITALCREGKLQRARGLVDEMLRRGAPMPDTHCYDFLVSAYCRRGRLDLAIELMDKMITAGCRPDIVNYNAILSGLCKTGRAAQALEVLGSLDGAGCAPNTSTYNALIGGLWSGGDRAGAMAMVEEMVSKGIPADEVTYNVLASCLCRGGMVDEARRLVGDMESCGLRPTAITYNMVMLGLCKEGRIAAAIDVLAEMAEKGCRANETTYVVLVEGIGYAGHRVKAAELAGELAARGALSAGALKRLRWLLPSVRHGSGKDGGGDAHVRDEIETVRSITAGSNGPDS